MNFGNLKITALTISMALSSATALASVTGGAGTWTGTGVVFNTDGAEVSQYQVEVINTATDDHTLDIKGHVTLADGKVIPITETMRDGDRGFSIVSGLGTGGGYSFGEGMISTYVTDKPGHAYASTIAMDGKDGMRVLVTELQDGKALRFIREKLVRKQ